MENDRKDTSHWLSKEEITNMERLYQVGKVMDITGRPYSDEASEIEFACRRKGVELSNIKTVKEIADKIIRRRNASGMLPSGQPCI